MPTHTYTFNRIPPNSTTPYISIKNHENITNIAIKNKSLLFLNTQSISESLGPLFAQTLIYQHCVYA